MALATHAEHGQPIAVGMSRDTDFSNGDAVDDSFSTTEATCNRLYADSSHSRGLNAHSHLNGSHMSLGSDTLDLRPVVISAC